METVRFEMLLRQASKHESELITRLEQELSTYGNKNTFLRECLARGYSILQQAKVDDTDPIWNEALASGYQGFRVLKTLLVDRPAAVKVEASAFIPVVENAQAVAVKTDEPKFEHTDVSVDASSVEGNVDATAKTAPNWGRFKGLAATSSAPSKPDKQEDQ